jgi:hypothetical protein
MSANRDVVARTPLQLACDFFSASPDEELYEAVQKSTCKRLNDFLEHYRKYAASALSNLPSLESGMLRPYLRTDTTTSGTAPWLWGAFGLGGNDMKEADSVWKAVDEIKHRLLYCHSVAVEDPFGIILALASSEVFHPKDLERHKAVLLNFINLLIHMRPLIERHVLCFVPPQYYAQRPLQHAPIEYLFNQFSKDRRSLPLPVIDEFLRRAPQDTREAWDSLLKSVLRKELLDTLRRLAISRVDATFSTMAYAPDQLSAYFPFRYDIKLIALFQDRLRRASERRNGQDRDSKVDNIPDRENRLLTELISIDLPGVSLLSPDEIVAIRQGDAFEEWRNTLKGGLQRASELDEDLLDFDKAARSTVSEALQPAYAKLKTEFKRSSFLSKAGAASAPLICGAIGGFAGYLVDPNVGGLVGALTGSFAEASVEVTNRWIKDRGKTSKEILHATKNHYVALLG